MKPVSPDTTVRVSLAETGALSFEGAPQSVRYEYASGAEATEELSVSTCPELVRAFWEIGGVEVSALIEVVSVRYCSLDDILTYREGQYQLGEVYGEADDAVWEARAQAEAVIERACNRALQPVMRTGWCDRPGCRTYQMAITEGGYDPDLRSIARAVREDGSKADVSLLRPGSPYIDMSRVPIGASVSLSYVSGLPAIPVEMREAVRALAAYGLSPRTSPDNATSMSSADGIINFVVAGVDGAFTALPEVNAVIQRYGLKDLQVG